jgi:hypothetical protein
MDNLLTIAGMVSTTSFTLPGDPSIRAASSGFFTTNSSFFRTTKSKKKKKKKKKATRKERKERKKTQWTQTPIPSRWKTSTSLTQQTF